MVPTMVFGGERHRLRIDINRLRYGTSMEVYIDLADLMIYVTDPSFGNRRSVVGIVVK